MLADGQNHLGNDTLLTVWPSLALFVTVLGFSLLGEGLGELRDARSRR
jgi:glutathione transport system permease protein